MMHEAHETYRRVSSRRLDQGLRGECSSAARRWRWSVRGEIQQLFLEAHAHDPRAETLYRSRHCMGEEPRCAGYLRQGGFDPFPDTRCSSVGRTACICRSAAISAFCRTNSSWESGLQRLRHRPDDARLADNPHTMRRAGAPGAGDTLTSRCSPRQ